jgi:hypothetical protein
MTSKEEQIEDMKKWIAETKDNTDTFSLLKEFEKRLKDIGDKKS